MTEALNVKEMDPREEEQGRMSSIEELTKIILDPEHPDQFVNVGSLLEPKLQEKLIQFLRKNQDVFTWCH